MFNSDEDPLSTLEARLRSWVPSPCGLNRDRMFFEAGRAGAQGPIQAVGSASSWRYATAAAVLLASGLGLAWLNERGQRRAPEPTSVKAAPPSALVPVPNRMTDRQESEAYVDPSSYLSLVRQVNRLEDVAGFDPHATATGGVPSVRAGDSPRTAPLRPRDWDRVTAL
jgi:hypothetical protein